MNYYDIAPLTRTSLAKQQAFTYISSLSVPIGSLIRISFSGSSIRGIVLKKVRRPNFPTKNVDQVIHESLLSMKQIKLAKMIAEEYFTSLGIVLKFFVPKISKKKTYHEKISASVVSKVRLTTDQKKALHSIRKMKNRKCLLFGPASSGKTEILFRLVEDNLKKNKQSLILIPELFLSQQEINRYQAFFSKQQVVFYHSKCKPSEIRNIYEGVADGSHKIIISTRIGVFLPFKNLGIVVVDEEQDPSFKQWDQMPKYHIRKISTMLGKLYGCKTVFSSATPSLETLHQANNLKIKMVRLPMLQTKSAKIKKPSIKLINLSKYYSKTAPFAFSKELKEILEITLSKNLIALFLVPKRGMGNRVICSDCRQVQKCPSCEIPLIHSQDHYRCLHCSYKKPLFSRCSNCSSLRLVDLGIGTERVYEDLKTHYPKARIITVDATSIQKMNQKSSAFKKIANNKVDFVVGTYAIAKGFDNPKVNCAVVLDAESWSGKLDFRHDEHWARDLMQLAGRLNRPGSEQNGTCLIQTFQPEKKFDFLDKWDWSIFADKELELRRQLSYPPYSNMLEISCKSTTEKNIDKKAKVVYNRLIDAKPAKKVRVSEPFFGFIKKKRNEWRKNILITYQNELPKNLRIELLALGPDWSIDVDPEFIF